MRLSPYNLLPALLAFLLCAVAQARPAEPLVALRSSVASPTVMRAAQPIGRLPAGQTISLALTLPLRNPSQLSDLLRRLYDPKNAQFHKYLTPQQFAEQFSPTPASYQAVAAYVQSQGLTVTRTYPSRTVLDVAGTTAVIEKAFSVRLGTYRLQDGRHIYANGSAPLLPQRIAVEVSGIAGLNNLSLLRRPRLRRFADQPLVTPRSLQSDSAVVGTGPTGGLAPADIKVAYDLNQATLDGTGQSLALYELDGYALSDVTAYETKFGLAQPPLTNVLVDGFNGAPVTGDGQTEVTLDIDMMIALVPSAKNIYVYEGANGTTAILDVYTQIANDNLASVVSSSWGGAELDTDAATRDGENSAFQQMAAQGQSMFNAAGDFGAFTNYDPTKPTAGATLSVADPASQPFVTGVGGTSLTLTPISATAPVSGTYVSETTWYTSSVDSLNGPEGGGGGISEVWTKPNYQIGFGSSPTNRDVPDVSLNADPNTGYDIFVASQSSTFFRVGGTSAAAPLWAAFTALVNQQRATNGLTAIGFLNPTLYAVGKGSHYAADFHDIADGSTNGYYVAVPGYDDATGLGTFIGSALLTDLSSNPDLGGADGTLNVTVTDSATPPNPISGATVTVTSSLTGAVKATGTTDATGAVTLMVPSGLALTVSVDGPASQTLAGQTISIPASGTGSLAAGGTLPLSFILNSSQAFAAGLQMISSPFDYSNSGDFAALFGLTLPLQSTDPRLIAWQSALNSYVYYPSPPADTLHRGQGYWVKFPAATYLHRSGIAGDQTNPFQITLQAGWNQIADPFTVASALSSLTVQKTDGTGSATLTSSSLVSPTLYRYDPPTNAYVALAPATDSLQPYAGYWMFANQAAVLVIPAGAPPPPGSPGGIP